VLFTDWVDSTRTAVRLGGGADDLRRAHFALLRGALAATGGTEIKSLGDGIMAVFDSTVAAIACAEAIQQAAERHNARSPEPMGIRIGISGGDVTVEDYDVFGIPVIEAARLCAEAQGSQILTTRVVQVLAGSGEAWRFADLGRRDLKGLEPGLETLEMQWASAEPSTLAGLPPGIARALDGPDFVGRGSELDLLRDAWHAATARRRGLVLLEGEPGAGKTRLAAEIARRASEEGALILFGRCDPDVPSPLRPWTAAVQQLVAAADPALLASHVTAHGGELTRMTPALADRVADLPAPREGDQDAVRLRLMDAVVELLTATAERLPVVLVLDDLHWADHASLVLLRHLLRAEDTAVFVVATVRDAEADRGEAFQRVAGDLAREPGTQRITVEGIDGETTLALLHQLVGEVETAPALAAAVREETDGNPLFTIELLRHLRDRGDLASALEAPGSWVSESATVRDVISQRVAGLGSDVGPLLCAAAILGRSFDLPVLADLVERPEGDVLALLERAAGASLLIEAPDRPGRFTFGHGLMQHVLSDTLSPTRVQLLHRRAAELLEDRTVVDPARAGQIAHHWFAAGERDRYRALDAAMAAADRALELLAPDEAATWLRRALALALTDFGEDDRRLAEVLLLLGDAERLAGDEAFRVHLLTAAEIARRAGADDLLVRSALSNSSGLNSSFLVRDDERIEVLRSALLVVPDEDLATRARLQATLASELWREREQRLSIGDAALHAARACGDPKVLVEVLYRRCLTIAEPDTLAERSTITAELLTLAATLDEPIWMLRASAERMRVCLEAGEAQEGVEMARRQARIAPRTGSAIATYMARGAESWLLARDGHYPEAEQAAQEAAQLGAGVAPDAFATLSAQLLPYRWDTGGLGELAELALQGGTAPGALSSQRAIVPLALAEAGRTTEARKALATAVADGLPIDIDTLATTTAVLWGEGIARLADPAAAAALLPRIEPWSEQVAFSGVSNFGSVARVCALLAALTGDDGAAASHFARAEELDRAGGFVGPLARTLADHGEWLVLRGEHEAAAPRIAEAADLALRHGLRTIAERCDAVGLLLDQPLS